MNIKTFTSQLPDEEKTPLVLQLLEIIQMQAEEIQKLKDEIAHFAQFETLSFQPKAISHTIYGPDNLPVRVKDGNLFS